MNSPSIFDKTLKRNPGVILQNYSGSDGHAFAGLAVAYLYEE
jgi:hypothetical protein